MALTINLGLTADATGSANVITATYSPAPTLIDKKILFLVSVSPNSSTTPTFNPNSLGAKTIVKNGGAPLSSGDIVGNGHVVILEYNATYTRWELLNPRNSASSQTLTQVLASGNTTSGKNIVITAGDFIESANGLLRLDFAVGGFDLTADGGAGNQGRLYVDSTQSLLSFTANNYLAINSTASELAHDTLINLEAPNVRLVSETASLILSTDASKNIKGLSTTTYPSLTELSYVKGVTSSIQTQLGTKVTSGNALGTPSSGNLVNCTGVPITGITGYLGMAQSGSVAIIASPADSTTYYCGGHGLLMAVAQGNRRIYFNKACTIKVVTLYYLVSGTLGTTETLTVSLRLNQTTDTTISSAVTWDALNTVFTNSGLSIAVAAGDYFEFKHVTPAWATNPTNVNFMWTIYAE